MIEKGFSGWMDLRRCSKEQMNGSDNERWHGLLQKTTGVSDESRDEDAEEMVGENSDSR